MDIKTFFETIFAGVVADTDLQTWANAQYSQAAKCYKGYPYNDPGDADDDAPWLALIDPEKESADDDRTVEITFYVWLVLSDSGTVTRGDAGIEPAAVDNIFDFVDKAKDAIRSVLPANFTARFKEIYDTVGALPEVHGYIECTFTQPVLIGSNPLD